MRVNM